MEITLFELATLGIAALGASLGIINTCWSLNQSRIKLKVVPAPEVPPYARIDGPLWLSIQITNLSTFPLTIDRVGALCPMEIQAGS